MLAAINTYDAKSQFSHFLNLAAQGEEVIIAKAGKPIAKLVKYEEDQQPRTPGYWKGKVQIADDFDDLPADLTAAFNGEHP